MKILFPRITLFLLLLLLQQKPAFASRVLYVTDTEGRKGPVEALIKAGELQDVGGKLQFTDQTTHLIFGGDLPDRGPDSIKLRKWFMSLKEQYPDRVTLIWGNRDLNKLDLARQLVALDQNMSDKYKDWLVKKITSEGGVVPTEPEKLLALLNSQNNKTNQIQWWMDFNGTSKGLEFHRQELEELTKRSVSLAEAADDMARSLDPKDGEFFKYLKMGGLSDVVDGHIGVVHGGITKQNMGVVPGVTENLSPKKWLPRLKQFGHDELELFQKDLAAGRTNSSSKVLYYGDAIWNDEWKKVIANDQSVVYPIRVKADGNFRLPENEVMEYLSKDGIDTVVKGHDPVGNTPLPLKKDGFLYFYGDTSYAPNGTHTTVVIEDGRFQVRGLAGDGTPINYTVSAKGKDILGYQYGDFVVSGKTEDGRYILNRYYDGLKIEEKFVNASEIDRMKLAVPTAPINDEIIAARKFLLESLQAKGVHIAKNMEEVGEAYGDMQPVLFSGASKLSFEDGTESKVRETVTKMLGELDPSTQYIVTGGTDLGFEKIVHEEALKRGFKIQGFAASVGDPNDFKMVDSVFLAGDDWDTPLQRALDHVKARKGSAVFISGGGVVKRGIEYAEKEKVDYYLMADVTGASGEQAQIHPERAFKNANEITPKLRNGKSAKTKVQVAASNSNRTANQKNCEAGFAALVPASPLAQ